MIEVTDEMVRAAQSATECDPAECDECIAKAVSAVLAIVERDRVGRCSATLPRLTKFGDLWCQLRHGHLGDHEMGPTRWKERDNQPDPARKGYETAIAVLRDVAERTGSPAAAWCADYLLADPDRLAPPPQ